MTDTETSAGVKLDDSNSTVEECWQCGGCGLLAGCFEDCCSGADCDPEDAEMCCSPSRCDICGGKDNYRVPYGSAAGSEGPAA